MPSSKRGRKLIGATGRSKQIAAHRYSLFVEAFITNGGNATKAAIAAGYNGKRPDVSAAKLLKRPDVQTLLKERTQQVVFDAQLSTERWAKEMASIGHLDPRELYDEAGNLIPIHKLPEHVRRAIASIEPIGDTGAMKVKTWDKNVALANIGRHLGMFERDNRQRTEGIKVSVVLVG